MKKILHLLNIDDFFPEMCEITLPLFVNYAKRIGAEINMIKERKFPDWPITYEKLQVYELGYSADYNILFDLDLIIRPDAPNITEMVPPNSVGLQGTYEADTMYYANPYFLRDGRKIGVCGNFAVTTSWTHDFWEPLPLSLDQAKQQLGRHWILDEYTMSFNIAKYGLKTVILDKNEQYFYHVGTQPYKLKTGEWVEESKESKLNRAKLFLERGEWTTSSS